MTRTILHARRASAVADLLGLTNEVLEKINMFIRTTKSNQWKTHMLHEERRMFKNQSNSMHLFVFPCKTKQKKLILQPYPTPQARFKEERHKESAPAPHHQCLLIQLRSFFVSLKRAGMGRHRVAKVVLFVFIFFSLSSSGKHKKMQRFCGFPNGSDLFSLQVFFFEG